MRPNEGVQFDSIWRPSSGKGLFHSISFPETAGYFIKERGNSVKKQMVQKFPITPVKREKRDTFEGISRFPKNFH